MHGRARTRAPAEHVWRALADPAALPAWFSGARELEVSPEYPGVGATIRWRVGPWRFEGRVLACEPTRLLRQVTRTPSGVAITTHRLAQEPDGRITSEKEVAATWQGWLWPRIGRAVVAPSVQKEVERVVRIAERASHMTVGR